MSVTKIV